MGVLEALLFSLIAVAVGAAVLARLDPGAKLEAAEFLSGAVVLGLAIFGFLVLGLALVTGNLRLALTASYVVGLLIVGLSLRSMIARAEQFLALGIHFRWWQPLLFLMFFTYLGILSLVMRWNAEGLPASILVGWGDGAYHLNIIGRLSTVNPFRLEQPIAAGEPLTYPLMVDFLSALLKKIGLESALAWHLPVFFLGSGLFWLTYLFGRRLLGKGSWATAFLFLIFFGAGLGFFWFFQDLLAGWRQDGIAGAWDVALSPPHEYTHLDSRTGGKPQNFDSPLNIVWMVPMVSFFSHQRSFILGAGLSILVLLGYWVYRKDGKVFPWWLGILGLLPFSHTHSFLSVGLIMMTLMGVSVFRRSRPRVSRLTPWVKGGGVAVLLSLPQVLFLLGPGLGDEAESGFFKPWFGWMTCVHEVSWFFCKPNVPGTDANPLVFWMKNFGVLFLFWPLAALYFLKFRKQRDIRELVLPSIVIFLVPNLLLFQPWEFDNNKALFYWWLLASAIVLSFLKDIALSFRLAPVLSAAFLLSAGLSGSIDIWGRLTGGLGLGGDTRQPTHYTYYGSDEVEVAAWIREYTSPNDAFLATDAANQFVPMLTGRPIYLGFTGWLWTQGRGSVIFEREAKIKRFLGSRNPTELCADGVRYWLFEPGFFSRYSKTLTSDASFGEVVLRHSSGKTVVRLPCGT